jgi:hypothetical protein
MAAQGRAFTESPALSRPLIARGPFPRAQSAAGCVPLRSRQHLFASLPLAALPPAPCIVAALASFSSAFSVIGHSLARG